MDPIALIALALAGGLVQIGNHLLEEGLIEPALEPITDLLKRWGQRDYRQAEKDRLLIDAIKEALQNAGAPVDDPDDLVRWLKQIGLSRLTAKQNDALRRQMARGVLAFIDPEAPPPQDLMVALGWPRSRSQELATLLTALRAQLSQLEDWRVPIEYADRAAQRGLLSEAMAHVAQLDNVLVQTEAGKALRVVVIQAGLSEEEVTAIESRYREALVKELQWHDFRGIIQMKQDTRLPLADIYLELRLTQLEDEEERQQFIEHLLMLGEAERIAEEERRFQERVTDALALDYRLVVLGGPGAGKTISLKFVALMLAHGYGTARLGLNVPYVPLMISLVDYAQELDRHPSLSLGNHLLEYASRAFEVSPYLPDFLRLALEEGSCIILLDGLDEVGSDAIQDRSLYARVVKKVQQFADRWCSGDQCNRVVVTSRIEGYWDEPLRGFSHVELSPLRPPDEMEALLLRWYAAHEQMHGTDPILSEQRARERVDELLPRILEWSSVRQLATNPLLLTILALIHENVGILPSRRITLYEICVQTLIESWRHAQTGILSTLLVELGEETILRVMASLAYWLHEQHPSGTASYEQWRQRLLMVLREEGFEERAQKIADRFLYHARRDSGLLAERGLGLFGFFHLTFEEYLAAREMARQRTEKRRELLRAHWEDPRWHEVILLAAGQLGTVEARRDDVSDFIEDLLKMESQNLDNEGRQAVLAGRALADVGLRSVTNPTRRWILRALKETMQDLNPETGHPFKPPRLAMRIRYEAGEVLDGLGWLPNDLYTWTCCPSGSEGGKDLMVMKYPVTNAQYTQFILAGGYGNQAWWGTEGWRWRTENYPYYRGKVPVTQPEYWRHPHFGEQRRGYPVVGVSWYETEAFCNWLTCILQRAREAKELAKQERMLVADLLELETFAVRLPTEVEWETIAGGLDDRNRYPWEVPGNSPTQSRDWILARTSVRETELIGTTPVAMYPLGASYPYGLMDLAGNVREWTASLGKADPSARVWRGGSWNRSMDQARCTMRGEDSPSISGRSFGFRCVTPTC